MKAGVCRGILYAAGFRSRLSMLRLLSMGSRIGERIAQPGVLSVRAAPAFVERLTAPKA